MSDVRRPERSEGARALRLELTGISKQYPAVKANDGVNLRGRAGEIHAVLGENGAGKSTLMKIIYGAVRPTKARCAGTASRCRSRRRAQARALGISMVFQHFSLFDTLTVAENVWLGLDKSLSLAEVTQRIREVAGRTASRSTRCGRCTRCRSASASASRSCARC